MADVVDRAPALFAARPVALYHGDFTPINMLTDGAMLTGLLDFESVRLADPLFDVASWASAVRFMSPAVLDASLPAFLDGAGVDATDPDMPERIDSIQILRMVELLVTEPRLEPAIEDVVSDRLEAMLRRGR